MRIALDAMGGDNAPESLVQGALAAVRSGCDVVLVGDEGCLRPLLGKHSLPIVHTADVAGMSDPPASIRRLPEASVRRALRLVSEGAADAVVSCGNTGATLVASVLDLGTLEGAERPAISTLLPRRDGGRLILLDAGANVDCRPELLACFAQLGVAYAEVLGVRNPRVGLLSNGEEDSKGNLQVRATLPLLQSLEMRFVGNVEPIGAMNGDCDVLVCDGFVGNILLKAAEGAVSTVVDLLKQEIRRRPSGWLGALLLRGAMRRFRERVAWDARGGALLAGVNGVVIVGHGRANAEAVCSAIQMASDYAERGLVARMADRLSTTR